MEGIRTVGRRVLTQSVLACGLATSVLAACTAAGVPHEESHTTSTGSVSLRLQENVPYATGRVLDIHPPPQARLSPRTGVPVIVLIHGCCGDRSDLGKLAEALAASGLLVFNVDWAGMDADATFPANYEDVACAIDFAGAHAAEYGADPERVIVAGWSDGAMSAAVAAAARGRFDRARCLAPPASNGPNAVVGIAGFYGWPLPVPGTYVTARSIRLFGGTPDAAPDSWNDATPYAWLSFAPPTVLLVGTTDPLLEDARRYAQALEQAGHTVRIVAMPPGGDQTLISPRTPEGRRVVAEVAAAGRTSPSEPPTADSAATSTSR